MSMTSRLRHHFVVRAVYCYCHHAYINVLTIAAMLIFLPLIQTFSLSAATLQHENYWHVRRCHQSSTILIVMIGKILQEKGTRSIGPLKTPWFSLELLLALFALGFNIWVVDLS
jgi:hypothetical protein